MFDLQTTPATCPGCGSECEAVRFGVGVRYVCDPCADADKARRAALERRERALAALGEVMPADFAAKIDPDRINEGIRPALEMSGREGIGLIGKTGTGKTRVAFHLLRKAAEAGLMPYAVTASKFRRAVSMRHDSEEGGRSAELIRACRFARVLLLDDVGKGAATDTADEALFDLLTERRDNQRVTIWTSNGNGKWIAARYGADRGPAIAIRLANLAGCNGKGTGRIFTATNETDGH